MQAASLLHETAHPKAVPALQLSPPSENPKLPDVDRSGAILRRDSKNRAHLLRSCRDVAEPPWLVRRAGEDLVFLFCVVRGHIPVNTHVAEAGFGEELGDFR